MFNLYWSFLLAAIGILGLYLAGSKNIWGWAVSFSAQGLWLTYAIASHQYGFILSAVAYGWVYGRNYYKWKRECREPSEATDLPTSP